MRTAPIRKKPARHERASVRSIAFFSEGATYQSTAKAIYLAPLFLLGAVIVLFGRETRGQELPD